MFSRIAKKLAFILSSEGRKITRLKRAKRYLPGSTTLSGIRFGYADAVSFAWQYQEIFLREHYKVPRRTTSPYIIDCGANVGVSVLYFRKTYHDATIIAFEPDPHLFEILRANLRQDRTGKTTLVNKAVWNTDGELQFNADGAASGRLEQAGRNREHITVPVTQLRPYLCKQVSLLKMDIEGAEHIVLEDCADLLHLVDKLFIEFHSATGKPQQLPKILSLLKEKGFRVYVESTTIINDQPFVHRSELSGFDNLLNIYAWRE